MDIDRDQSTPTPDNVFTAVYGKHSWCRKDKKLYCQHVLEFNIRRYSQHMTDIQVIQLARDEVKRVMSAASRSGSIKDHLPVAETHLRVTLNNETDEAYNAYLTICNRLLDIHDMLNTEYPWFGGLPWISEHFKVERAGPHPLRRDPF